MRKFLCFILLLQLGFSLPAHAQHDEIDISSGIGPGVAIFNVSDWLMQNDFEPSKFAFTYSASYSHYLRPFVSIGLVISYFTDQGTNKYQNSLITSSDSILGNYKRQTFIIAPQASFPYYIQHGFKMYARVSVGLRFSYEDYNYNSIAHYPSSDHQQFLPVTQITPLGFRFGTFAGSFIEFGWGYKGMINLGLFCKF
jgi:hypothetical protein